ncbi:MULTISPECIES: hypothetical protein [unclassified Actinotalea]|uniref:hypothetical protein n=1 Tax=unclassified Actinotalea TaxID=2638618 RepID=UPI0015F3A28B|nr:MULTISPECIES: hypothetical protein [unclassified Actinotalea]
MTEVDTPDGTPYARVTLAADHPALTIDETKVDPAVLEAGYTHDQLAQITSVGALWVVEEGVDSILVDSVRVDEWAAANMHRYMESSRPDVLEALDERTEGKALSALVDNDVLGKRAERGYALAYEPGAARIQRFHMAAGEHTLAPNGDPAVTFTGFLVRLTNAPGGQLEGSILCFEQAVAFADVDGQWLMSSWRNSFVYADRAVCAERGYDDRWGPIS